MPLFKTKDPTVPPGQTVTSGFPVLHVGDVPVFDPLTWRLRFFGLCENPFELSWDELRAEPTAEWRGDIHCVPRWSPKDTLWRGVPFRRLVERAKPTSAGTPVGQHAYNNYPPNLPCKSRRGDDFLVACEFGWQPLEPMHGGPIR